MIRMEFYLLAAVSLTIALFAIQMQMIHLSCAYAFACGYFFGVSMRKGEWHG